MAKKKQTKKINTDILKNSGVDESHIIEGKAKEEEALKAKEEPNNRGPLRRIPIGWKQKTIRMNPATAKRLERIKYESKMQDKSEYFGQDLVLNAALIIGFDAIENELNINREEAKK